MSRTPLFLPASRLDPSAADLPEIITAEPRPGRLQPMRAAAIALCLLAAAGCEKDLLAGMDAAAPDAAGDAATSCGAPTTDASGAAKYTVYLNFDGVSLTKGLVDDARNNVSQVLNQSSSVLTPYLDGQSYRQVRIDTIVGYVRQGLAPYSIDVVTTRPTSGDYLMTVLGDEMPGDLGFPAGVGSIAPATCDPTNRNRVSIEFNRGQDAIHSAFSITSDIGAMVGLAVTSTPGDCMCRGAGCELPNGQVVCTFGSAATTDATWDCGRTPTQDEPALLLEIWGCR